MRILHCLRAPVGGLFRHVLDLAAEQAVRGHDVGILADSLTEDRLTASKFAAIADRLRLGIIRTPMTRQPGLGDFSAYRTVRAYAQSCDLDVLHGHGAKGGAYARLAARALKSRGHGIKAFYTPHGGSLNYRPGSLPAQAFLAVERRFERHTDGLIFESAYASRIYRERIGGQNARQRVIPNGLGAIDLTLASVRDDATDIVFVGELRRIKGVHLLLDALASLNAEKPVTATIVGAGPDTDALKAQASALGLNGIVTFTGALPAREAFTRGRIMAVPSLAESFPYVVLEAAAAGLPLVATSVGGIPEIVEGTDTALIEPGRADAIASGLRSVLADPAAALARAQRLRENVGRKFTIGGMADAVLEFYGDPARTVRDAGFRRHREIDYALLRA